MILFIVCNIYTRIIGLIILALRSSRTWSIDNIWYIKNVFIYSRKLNRILIITIELEIS